MVDEFGQTSVPGVYAAGDMSRRPSMPFQGAQIVVAAASGVAAAVGIDRELVMESLPIPPGSS
jgi:thioredoxin reductase